MQTPLSGVRRDTRGVSSWYSVLILVILVAAVMSLMAVAVVGF
jgi:hypothetical protein